MRKTQILKKTAVCALAVTFLLSACGASKASSSYDSAAENSYDYDTVATGAAYSDSGAMVSADEDFASSWDGDEEESVYAEEAMEMDAAAGTASAKSASSAPDADSEDQTEQSSSRKIIYTGNISLQTLDYDESAQSIHDKITKYGGFIENEDTYNEDPYWYYSSRSSSSRTRRNLNITARIPADKFDAFMEDLKNDGQVTNTSVNARNVSVTYATREASKKALEIEQERLLEMMDKAETVEDMIAVEERLTEVERELNSEKTELSAMDRDVNFSTIYIYLQEVFEYTEEVVEVSYGERLQRAFRNAIDGFVEFWQELVLFLVENFPFLIMFAIVIVVLVRLLRRRRRRRMEEKIRMEVMRKEALQKAGVPYEEASSAKKERRRIFPWQKNSGDSGTPGNFGNPGNAGTPGNSGNAGDPGNHGNSPAGGPAAPAQEPASGAAAGAEEDHPDKSS